jgi:uncharacterized protein YfaP (DUF2135 family)
MKRFTPKTITDRKKSLCQRFLVVWMALMLMAIIGCGGSGGGSSDSGDDGVITYSGSGTGTTEGGSIRAEDVTITIRAQTLADDVQFTVSEVDAPATLPTGLTQVGSAIDISVGASDHVKINGPVKFTVQYDDTDMADETKLLVLHHDATLGYQAVRILSQDTTANTISFESRSFSPFVLALVDLILPTEVDTGFTATSDGWNIDNFGSYFSPNGNCLGMSGYATWFYAGRSSENLNGKFDSSVASFTAMRAHLAQSQSWAIRDWREEQLLSEAQVVTLMKAFLYFTNQPLILTMGVDGSPRHASVVYGYDADNFYFYDVNDRDTQQTLSYTASAFGTYGSYNSFGFVALPSLGRTEDFEDLTVEAEAGFTTSSLISLTAPTAGQQINAHNTDLTGSLSGSLNSSAQLLANVKGVWQTVPVTSGSFDVDIPVSYGDNTIILLAGVPISNQSNWYKNSACLFRTIEGTLAATDLLTTLTWNQSNTDVDLYVTDPNGDTAWYSTDGTTSGLVLDFDNTTGYGPEHITLTSDTSGEVLDGNYTVSVHYYSNHREENSVASGHVSIVVNEGDENQASETVAFSFSTDDSSNDAPGSTGPDWVQIADVDIVNGIITLR